MNLSEELFHASGLEGDDHAGRRPVATGRRTEHEGCGIFVRRGFRSSFLDQLARKAATADLFHEGMTTWSTAENGKVAAGLDTSPGYLVVDSGGDQDGFLLKFY
ncbi:hypothetical protein [Saccharopolyspora hattusasensis]|uniref:hypothetical protein n=1 Tax=Saccharopolyspora hattusasensis TaxID=1128679 RepID=UPI003D975ABE